MHSIYNIACSVFKMPKPPARLREREKQRAQKLQALIEKLTLKVQKKVHNMKEKFRKKRARYFDKEKAAQLARVQRMSQIKSLEKELSRKDDRIAEQEDLLAVVLEQACARGVIDE